MALEPLRVLSSCALGLLQPPAAWLRQLRAERSSVSTGELSHLTGYTGAVTSQHRSRDTDIGYTISRLIGSLSEVSM